MSSEALPARASQNRTATLTAAWRRSWPYLRNLLVNGIVHKRVWQKAYPGLMHAFLFWGVTIQVLGTLINLMQMQLFIPFLELSFPRGGSYLAYELVMDLAGLAILVGVVMALFRRLVLRPASLETGWQDYYALGLLALIPLVGFNLEATRLVVVDPAWASWSPVGVTLAGWWRALGFSPDAASRLHPVLFWIHAGLGLLLVASIPFTKLRHLVITPLQAMLPGERRPGTLALIDDFEEAESFGVGQVAEFTPSQLRSFDACVRCGRCETTCPASCSGMPYSPRLFVQSLRQRMVDQLVLAHERPETVLLEEPFFKEAPWFCTTCGACLQGCPAFVNPVDAIIDLRRYQILTAGRPPQPVVGVLRNLERQGNPWGMPAGERITWAEGLGVPVIEPGQETDVLLFLGCAFAYDDRNKQVAQAFVRLLQKAGVDFATLGFAETCCGETARRLGEEYLFQLLAEQNMETLNQVKFNRIVTQCPHCFNTLKNEYPQLGGMYPVQHYTQYLAEIWPKLSVTIRPETSAGRYTYHDPCYLGRYNDEYTAPRQLLRQVGIEPVEMERRGPNSFCCGGGGGQMWLETDAETRINHRRLGEAIDAQAEVVATACPYCLLMFDDAIRSQDVGERLEVRDISEILLLQLADEAPPPATQDVVILEA
jgi:Fe-S oxidoreductase/nitrate reductase gamma subunit